MYEEVSKQVLTDIWPIGILVFLEELIAWNMVQTFLEVIKTSVQNQGGSKLGKSENHFRGRLIYGITAQMREINEDILHKY